jgi:hypothetical protein
MAMLDVWVARPGAACRVDDHDWFVRVEDAHGTPYEWAGHSYGSMPAPHAHWAGTIPPGTYVVRAARKAAKQGDPTEAAPAIVEVPCDGVACVRLYVAPLATRQPGRTIERPSQERPPSSRPPTRNTDPSPQEPLR